VLCEQSTESPLSNKRNTHMLDWESTESALPWREPRLNVPLRRAPFADGVSLGISPSPFCSSISAVLSSSLASLELVCLFTIVTKSGCLIRENTTFRPNQLQKQARYNNNGLRRMMTRNNNWKPTHWGSTQVLLTPWLTTFCRLLNKKNNCILQ